MIPNLQIGTNQNPDPDASKPEDWDDEMDGEWEPPMVDNPDYKGEWQAVGQSRL